MNLKERMKISNSESKKSKILIVLIDFFKNNIKEYFIISTIFLIGIFLGVMFINNCAEEQKTEISSYINTYIEAFKQQENNNNVQLLQNNIKDNIILAIIMWFVGSTVIGIPIVIGIIAFRGFCLGYTISALTFTFGVSKGITFTAISIIMQNILFIPALISLGVSSIKIYKSILNDKRKENIKTELIRHTAFSIIIAILLLLSALIETEVSTNLLKALIKYF